MNKWTAGPSKRSTELPSDWPNIRTQVIARDQGRCTERMDTGAQCPERGTDVDHIDEPFDHRLNNLRLLCTWHHDAKTARQGATARALMRRKLRHPGIGRPFE